MKTWGLPDSIVPFGTAAAVRLRHGAALYIKAPPRRWPLSTDVLLCRRQRLLGLSPLLDRHPRPWVSAIRRSPELPQSVGLHVGVHSASAGRPVPGVLVESLADWADFPSPISASLSSGLATNRAKI